MNTRDRLKNGKPLHLAISVLLMALVLLAGIPSAVSADDGTDVCRDDGPIDHLGSSDVVRGADNLPSKFTGICFLKGTLVKTENGEKPIEDMQAGDQVWSYDTESGKWQLETVSETFEHNYSGDIITIDVAGSEIVATGNHPFWVVAGDDLADRAWPEDIYIYEKAMTETGRWVEARDLRVGDELLLTSGRACITGLAIEDLDTTVYNIGVGEQHTYAVSEAGVLVHNKAMRNSAFVDDGIQLELDFMKQMPDAKGASGLVIGRSRHLSEVGALRPGEYTLGWLDVRKTLGFEGNWAINQAKLGKVMEFNKPIRDATSYYDRTSRYLNAERQMLRNAGWKYQNGWWVPPM